MTHFIFQVKWFQWESFHRKTFQTHLFRLRDVTCTIRLGAIVGPSLGSWSSPTAFHMAAGIKCHEVEWSIQPPTRGWEGEWQRWEKSGEAVWWGTVCFGRGESLRNRCPFSFCCKHLFSAPRHACMSQQLLLSNLQLQRSCCFCQRQMSSARHTRELPMLQCAAWALHMLPYNRTLVSWHTHPSTKNTHSRHMRTQTQTHMHEWTAHSVCFNTLKQTFLKRKCERNHCSSGHSWTFHWRPAMTHTYTHTPIWERLKV